jgi:hypothetical protein
MSGELGIALAVLTLSSCWASYALGKWEERIKWENIRRRERERRARWVEFEEDEE